VKSATPTTTTSSRQTRGGLKRVGKYVSRHTYLLKNEFLKQFRKKFILIVFY
jgi:hypothetical protein